MSDDSDAESSGTLSDLLQTVRRDHEQLADALDRITGLKKPDGGYYPPSSEYLGYDDKHVLIRLDVAVYAVHLAMARAIVRPLPHVVRVRIQKTKERIEAVGAEVLSFFAAWKLAGFVFRLAVDLVELWRENTQQMDLEKSLRNNVERTQRQLNDWRLGRGHGRVRKDVHTRH